MKERVIQLLGLQRDAIFQDARIPKTKFFEIEGFTSEDKKIFTNEVEEIRLLAVINEDTINIPSYKNEEVNYSEVYFVYISLKKILHASRIAEIIQENIPNPAVVVISFEQQVYLSTATKRLNKGDKKRQVLEGEQSSGWLSLSNTPARIEKYLKGLNIANFSFQNLFIFYQEFSRYIYQSFLLEFSHEFNFLKNISNEELSPHIEKYETKRQEVRRLRDDEQKTLNFGERVSVHQRLIRAESEELTAKNKIEELLQRFSKVS